MITIQNTQISKDHKSITIEGFYNVTDLIIDKIWVDSLYNHINLYSDNDSAHCNTISDISTITIDDDSDRKEFKITIPVSILIWDTLNGGMIVTIHSIERMNGIEKIFVAKGIAIDELELHLGKITSISNFECGCSAIKEKELIMMYSTRFDALIDSISIGEIDKAISYYLDIVRLLNIAPEKLLTATKCKECNE